MASLSLNLLTLPGRAVIMIKEDGSEILRKMPCHLWASEFTEPVDKPTPVVDKVNNF
jgi:hypothetical protein